MILIVGLVLLVLAAVVAVAGIFTNTGSAHALTHTFSLFGHHVTGSTGTLFLIGIIVGAVAMLGLGLLLTGARRTSRRGAAARHGLRQSRRETATAARARDDMTAQRDTARAQRTAVGKERDDLAGQRDDLVSQERGHTQSPGTPQGESPNAEGEPTSQDGHRRPHLLGHRFAHR